MARQPENRSNRGRRSESTLDWLNRPDSAADEAPPKPLHRAAVPPSNSAPPTLPPTLTRRAARAQRDLQPDWRPDLQPDREPFASHPAAAPANPPSARAQRPRQSPEQPDEPAPDGLRRAQVAAGLTIAALMLAVWSATVFIDSSNFVIAGLAMLAPMVSVFALPVIAIGVGSKHAVPTAIAIVAALLPWALVVGYAIGDSGFSPVATGSTLRVMSVDGDQGNASAADIVQVARAYSADVVVVTGLSSGLAHDLTVAGLDSLASAQWVQIPAGSTDGAGLWSRLKVVDLQPMRELSQPGVKGVIGSGADQIAITVAHIGAEPLQRSPSWRSDLTQLTDQTSTAGRGFIIGGLGATPWQPAFRKLTGAGWRDAADIVGRGLRPTWPSWSPLPIAPLDHVLVTKDLGVGGADTTNIAGTDHRALIVTLIEPRSGD